MVVTKGTREKGIRGGRMSHRTAFWLAWSLWAVCVVLIGLTLLLDFLTTVLDRGQVFAILALVLSLAYPTVGALIASRLPANPIGWIFCGVGLLYAGGSFTDVYPTYALRENPAFPDGEYVAWLSELAGFEVLVMAAVFVMVLFPDGHLLSRRWRIVAWMALCGAMPRTLSDAFSAGELDAHPYVQNPFGVDEVIGGLTTPEVLEVSSGVGLALLWASTLAALFSLFVRLHRAQGDERQQLKWFLYAAVPAVVGFSNELFSHFIWNFTALVFNKPFEPYGPFSEFMWIISNVFLLPQFALLFVPVFTYIAILRYHLYDIDVVINRTLVYGALSACVVGIYMLVVVALGALFQARGNLAVALLATALVAVLFQPLRMRLQRGVNRLMYGERDDPYAVISRLGKRLEATLAPETVLPTVVETIAQALKLPYAAILLKEGEGFRSAAAYGSPTAESEAVPLVYQREEIGRLLIAPRAPGEGFSEADRSLLEDLARQAEVAVHAVRLTSDLQQSRERLVATREEERRRLRRDLHDGLGAQLAGLNVQAGALRR